ncbi:hypothetical protein BJ322DRAFT_1109032 [Thelephora terrestris]|uniref:DUF6593 domain-containing protein n=1 Tax=Thelephora terrestris TaxID=56493 RepID=A0A9P6HFI0_9AGAM|nr:hypothetical protein BJ322DRAFT_1109032 [Thelephora terrestris]
MHGCTLSLSRDAPLRTSLIDEATGQAVYEIDTSQKLLSTPTTKIRKLDPAARPHPHSGDVGSGSDENTTDTKHGSVGTEEDEPGMELPETSDEMARIYWKFISDRIIFRGKITTQREFLPECGKMKGSYKFTGPDGVEYRWAMGVMGANYPKLVTMDEKKTVIAQFHRAHYFTKKQNARLQVEPSAMHMLDHIVLTFTYVESKRRERETQMTASTAGAI